MRKTTALVALALVTAAPVAVVTLTATGASAANTIKCPSSGVFSQATSSGITYGTCTPGSTVTLSGSSYTESGGSPTSSSAQPQSVPAGGGNSASPTNLAAAGVVAGGLTLFAVSRVRRRSSARS